jgi:hypothetical protein
MELKDMMSHPASLREIMSFSHGKVRHVLLWLLGKMPAWVVVELVKAVGKVRHLI